MKKTKAPGVANARKEKQNQRAQHANPPEFVVWLCEEGEEHFRRIAALEWSNGEYVEKSHSAWPPPSEIKRRAGINYDSQATQKTKR